VLNLTTEHNNQRIMGGVCLVTTIDVRIVEVRADNSTVQKKVKSKSHDMAVFVENA
jgi:hypothetical protein